MNRQAPAHPFDLLLEIDRRNIQRSQSASAEAIQPSDTRGRLAVRLGSRNLMFPMREVAEIIPIPRITRVPGVQSWLMGIANLRGTVISVVDIHGFFFAKLSTITANSRLIVVRSGEWTYGLLVDEIIGMRHFSEERKLEDLDDVDDQLLAYITEGFESDKKKWLAFNVSRLLTDPKFLDATD